MRYVLLVLSLAAAPPPDSARFVADSKMVLVPATVLDRNGGLVTGLPANAFVVSQDDRVQSISSFGEQDLPASIGVVFDISGSMSPVLAQAKSVLSAFFRQCNPKDEAFIYTVSGRPDLNSEFTGDFGSLVSRTTFLAANGATALTDTIFAAVRKSRVSHNPRRALLIVSDGMDNHSRYSKAELMSAAVEAYVQIYSISIFNPPVNKKGIELQEERQGLFFLEELSKRTGGIQVVVRNGHDTERAAETMGKAIRNQYVIGYVPSATATDKTWHTVQVRLAMRGATVYSRPGFFSR